MRRDSCIECGTFSAIDGGGGKTFIEPREGKHVDCHLCILIVERDRPLSLEVSYWQWSGARYSALQVTRISFAADPIPVVSVHNRGV